MFQQQCFLVCPFSGILDNICFIASIDVDKTNGQNVKEILYNLDFNMIYIELYERLARCTNLFVCCM